MAINKPTGVAVHGGSGVQLGVIEQLRQARPQAQHLELIHRRQGYQRGAADCKEAELAAPFANEFRERETGKTYLALVKVAWPVNLKMR